MVARFFVASALHYRPRAATIVNNAVLFVESRADADDDGYKRH
jgi:hypothetical protein